MKEFSIGAIIAGFIIWLLFRKNEQLKETIARIETDKRFGEVLKNRAKLSVQQEAVRKSQEAFDEAFSTYNKHISDNAKSGPSEDDREP